MTTTTRTPDPLTPTDRASLAIGATLVDGGWTVDRSGPDRYVRDTREIRIYDDGSYVLIDEDGDVGDGVVTKDRDRLLKWAFRPEIERARWHMVEALKQMEWVGLPDILLAYRHVNEAQCTLADWLGVRDTTDPKRPRGLRGVR